MITKSQAVKNFLMAKARPELASLYNFQMECQVNVAQDMGERVDGDWQGKKWTGWTDGGQMWKSFRIPHHANSKPEYLDKEIKFDLAAHAEGIGMTGWDWSHLKSKWVAFDFDAIVGHSEAHEQKLTDVQLREVREAACAIPWVTVRQSTSGSGLHLYVTLNDFDTENHNEHAALARAILSKMSALAGFDFDSKVDNCGGNIWVWHRKFEKVGGRTGPGLKLIKSGEMLLDPPPNWRDHIAVTTGKRRKNAPGFVEPAELDFFEEFCGQRPKTPIDEEHRKLMAFLDETGSYFWFDSDNHMLVAHTWDLQQAHEKLGLRGIFKTLSQGREHGADQNCFAYPQRRGAWSVRRHTKGVAEADTWTQDASGWTHSYLNREPDLSVASRTFGGKENEQGGFEFREAELAVEAAKSLGANLEVPSFATGRPAILKGHKDGRLIVSIKREQSDSPEKMKDWLEAKGGYWKRILPTSSGTRYEPEVGNYDDLVRHLVTEMGDYGWVLKSDGQWGIEPLEHIRLALASMGLSKPDISTVLGSGVIKRWMIVNRPFQPEYPGDRQWNRGAAQLAFAPSTNMDNLNYEHWLKILSHCGAGLDVAIKKDYWCSINGITSGADYLKCWLASLFQHPTKPLPYLFLYGPQGSGKTIFHEAVSLLVTRGVERADNALISQAGFNAELENAIVCVIEETNLSANKSTAYNRMKDLITSRTISIHRKGRTPYSSPNLTHWIQCSNHEDHCPIFPGDTRITMAFVDRLKDGQYIDKMDLFTKLEKEAPDFLAALLAIELPKSNDRLNVPIIATDEKKRLERSNRTELEAFIDEHTYPVSGSVISVKDFFEKFVEHLDPERISFWSKIRVGKEMPAQYPKGRLMSQAANWYFANISWENKESTLPRYTLEGDKLTVEGS